MPDYEGDTQLVKRVFAAVREHFFFERLLHHAVAHVYPRDVFVLCNRIAQDLPAFVSERVAGEVDPGERLVLLEELSELEAGQRGDAVGREVQVRQRHVLDEVVGELVAGSVVEAVQL